MYTEIKAVILMFSQKFIKGTNEFTTFENHIPAPYLRKSFMLDFVPENAQITICGLGFYELYINGINITKGHLAPYISSPDDLVYYDRYDIKSHLSKGENVIGIILGNGFINPFDNYEGWEFDKVPWRNAPCVSLQFEATDKNNCLSFEADESFKTHSSPILMDGLRSGYRYNSNLEIDSWNLPGFDDSLWANALIADTPKGEPKLCEAEPIKVIKKIKPVAITHHDELYFALKIDPTYKAYEKETSAHQPESKVTDVYVYDFGVNAAGVCQIKINGKKGQKIRLKHGETLIDGKFNMNSIYFQRPDSRIDEYEYKQTDEYILKGGEEILTPKFTYHGFRYVMVEGLEKEQATEDLLTYVVMNSDLKPRAAFSCSDENINKLYEMCVRSDLANFYYFPTDCPHREKNGWTGDASVSAPHMLLNYYCGNSFKEWLNNVRKAQNSVGAYPGIVPTGGWGFDWGNGPIWDSVITNLCYYTYRYEGNIEIIKDNKDSILTYLKYIAGRRDEKGLIHVGLGDWMQPARKWDDPLSSPLEYTDSATIFDMCKKSEFMFDLIGFDEGKIFATKLKEELKSDIRKHLIDFDTMTAIGNCITSQCTAIWFGIFEENEIPKAFDRLVEIIESMEIPFLDCGMFGLRYIFRTLSKYGRGDLAYKLIMQKGVPSYYRFIKCGFTSLGEQLSYSESSLFSCNHHFLGDISAWFIEKIAGLNPNPTAKDINEVEISPDFLENIDFANASFETKGENLSVNWNRENGKIILVTSVPEHIHGKIKLPYGYEFENGKQVCDLKSGENTYIIK